MKKSFQQSPAVYAKLRAHVGHEMMKDWCHTFSEDLWLKPDDIGAEEATFIKKALRLRRGQSVLDAPCGAGRIAIHLAHAGCNVTGIDLRQSFTDRAAARFHGEKQRGRFHALDLRQMQFSREFHGIYSWLGSFGYFAEADNLDVMKRYAEALRPGGRLLIDQPNREAMLRHFVTTHSIRGRTARNSWNKMAQRIESDWIVKRSGKAEHNYMSIRLYTFTQMKELFEKSGLAVDKAYGSTFGEPYGRSSKRLILVGRK